MLAPITDLQARAKSGKIDLTWTPVAGAAHYTFYRRQGSGPYRVLTAGYATSTGVYAEGGLSNGVPLGAEEDVALGWEFSLGGQEFARLAFGVSDTGGPAGLHLQQVDPDSGVTLSAAGTLHVVPEPGTLVLLGSGLAVLAWMRRKRLG